jgi:hypothetical protein
MFADLVPSIKDPERKMTIATYTIPVPFEDDCPAETCQDYVRIGAETGTLWDWYVTPEHKICRIFKTGQPLVKNIVL